jgi:endogenous inhibitor of DNA gyrase (YacG/DUF329 family)
MKCKQCGNEINSQSEVFVGFCSDECYTEYVTKNESKKISIEFWDWK